MIVNISIQLTPLLTLFAQIVGNNISISHFQIGGNNMSMPHGQNMNISSIGPNLELIAISYSDNQPIDPKLQNSIFSLILLVEVDKFLGNDAQNITCSLLRIRTFIKQYLFSDKQAADLPVLKDYDIAMQQLLNTIYESK